MPRPSCSSTKATRSRKRPDAVVFAAALLGLAACAPTAPKGVSKDKLDQAVSEAIGDVATCVMMAEKASGKVVYRYNTNTVCARQLPSCQGAGKMTVKGLLDLTVKDGQPHQLSCNTTPDNSRGVAWASAVLPQSGVAYAAVMEGTRTFPGRMMADRLEPRLADAGLK